MKRLTNSERDAPHSAASSSRVHGRAGCAGGDLRSRLELIEQDDVPDPRLGQVIGGREAEGSGADDDRPRGRRNHLL